MLWYFNAVAGRQLTCFVGVMHVCLQQPTSETMAACCHFAYKTMPPSSTAYFCSSLSGCCGKYNIMHVWASL